MSDPRQHAVTNGHRPSRGARYSSEDPTVVGHTMERSVVERGSAFSDGTMPDDHGPSAFENQTQTPQIQRPYMNGQRTPARSPRSYRYVNISPTTSGPPSPTILGLSRRSPSRRRGDISEHVEMGRRLSTVYRSSRSSAAPARSGSRGRRRTESVREDRALEERGRDRVRGRRDERPSGDPGRNGVTTRTGARSSPGRGRSGARRGQSGDDTNAPE